jgi:hypothetical protein
VGPAAACLPLMARKTWAAPPGAAAPLAGAKRRPPRARGVCGRAPGHGRQTLAGRPLQPGGPPSSGGGCRRPSPGSRACRRAAPTCGSPRVGRCRRRRGGQRQGRRAGPRAAWAHATAVACPCPARAGRSGQLPPQAVTSRPAAAGRRPAGRGPLAPRRAPRGPRPLRGGAWVDRPGHHGAARSLSGYCEAPGLSGTAYPRGTGLALDHESRRYQPGVAGETRTDGGGGHAHCRGGAGVDGDATAGPALSPRA